MAEIEKEKSNGAKSKLLEEYEKRAPLFSSNSEAIQFYNLQLEEVATRNSFSVEKFIELAHNSLELTDDQRLALNLFRKINSLK